MVGEGEKERRDLRLEDPTFDMSHRSVNCRMGEKIVELERKNTY